MNKIKLIDSFKIGWFNFARSRGWKSSVTLSNGLHMEGSNATFEVRSPLYKFTDDGTYKTTPTNKQTVGD